MGFAEDTMNSIVKFAESFPVVQEVSKKTGMPVSSITFGVFGAVLFFILLGLCPSSTLTLIAAANPLYSTIKVLESDKKNDGKHCLTYWLIFGAYCFFDVFVDLLLSWLPFYYTIKLGALVYLFWPQTAGAIQLYNKFVKPFMAKHENQIDNFFESIGKTE